MTSPENKQFNKTAYVGHSSKQNEPQNINVTINVGGHKETLKKELTAPLIKRDYEYPLGINDSRESYKNGKVAEVRNINLDNFYTNSNGNSPDQKVKNEVKRSLKTEEYGNSKDRKEYMDKDNGNRENKNEFKLLNEMY